MLAHFVMRRFSGVLFSLCGKYHISLFIIVKIVFNTCVNTYVYTHNSITIHIYVVVCL